MDDTSAEARISDAPVKPGAAQRPARAPIAGRWARLEPLDAARHGAALFAAAHDGGEAARHLWDYLPYGPFESDAAFVAWTGERAASADPLFFAICRAGDGRAQGMASYLNIVAQHRTIEIGHIWLSPALQRTREASEAIFLMMAHVFDALGYRRVEWKCNALNGASRRAALRFGFRFEGLFLRHMIVKGRNRDTAWYAVVEDDWPALRAGFEAWLDPANFDAEGRQKARLADLITGARS